MARLHRGRARREADRQNMSSPLMFWVRLIIVFLLVALLVVQVLRILDQSSWRQSELETAVYRFGQTAMLVNSEWLRRGRQGPVEVQIGGQTGLHLHDEYADAPRLVQFHVHEYGWPLATVRDDDTGEMRVVAGESMSDRACDALWAALSQAPELLGRGLKGEWHAEHGLCLYHYQDEKVFAYRLQNGHVMTL